MYFHPIRFVNFILFKHSLYDSIKIRYTRSLLAFMNKIQNIIKKLYWLGLIGIIGTVFHIKYLKLFYLFFLLAFVDICISLRYRMKYGTMNEHVSNLKYLCQNIMIIIGNICIYIRHGFCIPNVKTYVSQVSCRLPFQGKGMVVNGGIDQKHSHSWGLVTQRYAYDFYMVENGKSYQGNGLNVYDYYCYDQPVLAVADGIVVEIKNKFEDTKVTGKSEVLCDATDARGNYIVIQHGSHVFSMIAHLKKDSFCVKVNDKVTAGQIIARCGNSGNSSEPHIHFQIQEGKNFYFSASLPVYFDEIINHSIKDDIHYIKEGDVVENR